MAMTPDTATDRPIGGPATYSGEHVMGGGVAVSAPGGKLQYLQPATDQQGNTIQGQYMDSQGNYYNTYNSGTGWTGAYQVGAPTSYGPMPPQQQAQQQTPSIPYPQQQAQQPQNTSPLVAMPWVTGATTQGGTPTATASLPSSTYNLAKSFQAPPQQQFQGGGLVQGFQDGGQAAPQGPITYSNPLFSLQDLGASALGSIFGTAYGTPVYNPMPNQQGAPGYASSQAAQGSPGWQSYQGGAQGNLLKGGAGQGGMTQGGIYSGPQYATFGTPAAVQSGGVWEPQGGIFQAIPSVFGRGVGNVPVSPTTGYQGNPVYSQAYPTGAPSPTPLTATPWATGTSPMAAVPTATGAQARPAQAFATAPMPGTLGIPGGPAFAGTAQPPPAPGIGGWGGGQQPAMMAGGWGGGGQPVGVAPPTAFGGTYGGYTAGVPGIRPYTGTVQNDPYLSHAVSTLLGLPANPWHNPDGSPRGGVGAGGGAGDTALAASMALATAPKGAPAAPVKAQSGGLVQGYTDGGTVQDPEVPKATLSVPQQGGGQGGQSQTQTTQANAQPNLIDNLSRNLSAMYSPPTATGGGGMGMGMGMGAGAGAAPSISTLAGEQAYVTGAPVAEGGGGLSQQQGNALASGIGAIGGAFQKAFQDEANRSWQWIPVGSWANPQRFPQPPTPQMAQPQVPQEQQRSGGAASYMATTAPYMASYAGTPYGGGYQQGGYVKGYADGGTVPDFDPGPDVWKQKAYDPAADVYANTPPPSQAPTAASPPPQRRAAASQTRRTIQPTQQPYYTPPVQQPSYNYYTPQPAQPGFLGRLGQTLGHFFTGSLGQHQQPAPTAYYSPGAGAWIGPSINGQPGYAYRDIDAVRAAGLTPQAVPVNQSYVPPSAPDIGSLAGEQAYVTGEPVRLTQRQQT